MKERLLKLALRLDALTLRERMMVFVAAAAVVSFGIYMSLLDPLYTRQAQLRQEVDQQQNNLRGIDAEVEARLIAAAMDPDQPNRKRLAEIEAETAKLGDTLRTMQRGLVAPERIVPLLEEIMRTNGRLRLVAMKTLPVTGLSEAAKAEPKDRQHEIHAMAEDMVRQANPDQQKKAATPEVPKTGEVLYRHGVELTVQGSYLDMVAYMRALESMPTQLFWGKATLDAQDYPNARLTLTLYTMSLDAKWMKL